MSVEAWAKKNKKRVLAVSEDADWAEYCKNCEYIDCIKTLEAALPKFQEIVDRDIESAIETVIDQLKSKSGDVFIVFEQEISKQVEGLDFELIADTSYIYDGYVEQVSLTDFEIEGLSDEYEDDEEKAYDYEYEKILSHSETIVSLGFWIQIECLIDCSFSLSIFDSTDKEEINIGTSSAERGHEFKTYGILDIGFERNDANIVPVLKSLNIENPNAAVEFGDIGIDSMEEIE